MKIIILALLLSAFISATPHYNDEDGHLKPWAEWKEASCVSEPRIIMDSSGHNPPCNANTGLGVTTWTCDDGSDELYHWSYYTSHWYCDVIIGEAKQIHTSYLPLVTR
jgi:hypothetical protein